MRKIPVGRDPQIGNLSAKPNDPSWGHDPQFRKLSLKIRAVKGQGKPLWDRDPQLGKLSGWRPPEIGKLG